MATVAQLQEEALRFSSLNTSDATETGLALRFLNEAYMRAVGLTGATSMDVDVTVVAGADRIIRSAYAPVTSASQGVLTVRSVYVKDADGYPLQRRGIDDILLLRSAESLVGDEPAVFAVRGNGDIEFWPASTGGTMTVEMDNLPLELVASAAGSGQETTPTAIPALFHRSVLLNFAIARLMQYRGLEQRSQFFMGEHERGMDELQGWLNDQGGIMGPPVRVRRHRQFMPAMYYGWRL